MREAEALRSGAAVWLARTAEEDIATIGAEWSENEEATIDAAIGAQMLAAWPDEGTKNTLRAIRQGRKRRGRGKPARLGHGDDALCWRMTEAVQQLFRLPGAQRNGCGEPETDSAQRGGEGNRDREGAIGCGNRAGTGRSGRLRTEVRRSRCGTATGDRSLHGDMGDEGAGAMGPGRRAGARSVDGGRRAGGGRRAMSVAATG